MGTTDSAEHLIRALATRHRVLMLGGMAVISYGLDRKTKDVDVWLEPMADAGTWASALVAITGAIPSARLWSLAQRKYLTAEEVADEIADFGVLRVSGLDRDVDIFRMPNEMEIEDFEPVWSRATELPDGIRLPHELDLYMTKANTGREHDLQDQLFLERRVKDRFRERLPVCDLEEARALLTRFADPEVLGFALRNSHADVRNHALGMLREFEADGDPFSRDLLATWNEPA